MTGFKNNRGGDAFSRIFVSLSPGGLMITVYFPDLVSR